MDLVTREEFEVQGGGGGYVGKKYREKLAILEARFKNDWKSSV